MEAAAVSVAHGAMGALLGKLADLLTGQYKLQKEAMDDARFLTGELKYMGMGLMIYKSKNLVKRIKTRHEFGKEFQALKGLVKEVSERHKSTLHGDATLVGIDKSRDHIIHLMTEEEEEERLKVLAIWGFGGLGKTTLANEVYGKLKGGFECQCFVSVSQKPNILKILITIFSQVAGHKPVEMDELHELIGSIRNFLKDKRYFIVIDDIWDANDWHIIKNALPENKNGSGVITTTRNENVAIACCSNNYRYIYKMMPLSNEDSRILFFKRIFGSEDGCPVYLKDVSTAILKRCGGLPLAIITISSLLATPRKKDRKEEWEHIMDSLGSNLELNPTLEGMRQILRLSYVNLPHYLKACMLYLGIYPEDHIIKKRDLVRQWAAQGFIGKASGQNRGDVAERYFNELVNRSIIQPVETEVDDDVLSCRVHDMMLDLIIHECGEENFVTIIDHDQKGMTQVHNKVRRLSLNLEDSPSTRGIFTHPVSQVRALAMFRAFIYTPPLLKFKLLRVLTVECRQSSNIDRTGICHLPLLSYVKVVTDVLKFELPSEIRGLQQLETLEIKSLGLRHDQNTRFPPIVVHLPQLLHLTIPPWLSVPERIFGCMKSLRTLRGVQLQDMSVDSIGDLTNLRVLKIWFDEFKWDNMASRDRLVALRSSIEKLCNLTYLHLYCEEQGYPTTCRCDEFSSLSDCPRRLQTLRMGCVSAFPRWISELHYLGRLKVWIKQVVGDDMLILAQLPCLLSLDLLFLKTPEEVVVISGTGFSRLNYFAFGSHRLAFDAGAMPALQKLEVRCNAHGWAMHGAAPAGIEHLKALRKVYVHIGVAGAKESNTRAAESAFRNAIDLHQGRPTANIQCKLDTSSRYDFDIWPPWEDEEEEPTQHPRDLDEL